MSVKGGCIEGLDWTKAIHIWAKNAMVPIPEGSETHSEVSEFTTYSYHDSESLDQPGLLAGSGGCHMPDSQEQPTTIKGACELSG